jgi:hypothetical protein
MRGTSRDTTGFRDSGKSLGFEELTAYQYIRKKRNTNDNDYYLYVKKELLTKLKKKKNYFLASCLMNWFRRERRLCIVLSRKK